MNFRQSRINGCTDLNHRGFEALSAYLYILCHKLTNNNLSTLDVMPNHLNRSGSKLFNTGVTTEMAHSEKSAIRITNIGGFIVLVATVFYFIYDLIFLPARETPAQRFWFFALHIGSVLIFFVVLFLNKRGLSIYARVLLILVLTSINSMNSLALGQPFRTEMYLYILAASTFVIFDDLRFTIPLFLLQGVAYFFTAVHIVSVHPSIIATQSGLPIRIGIAFTILFFVLFFLKRETVRYQREIERKNYQLSIDRTNSEKLLFTKDKIFSILSHDLRILLTMPDSRCVSLLMIE